MSDPLAIEISIPDAEALVASAMRASGFSAAEAATITSQIIGCELRGHAFAGLSRAISIIERARSGATSRPLRVLHNTPVSALIDGGDSCGYLVADAAVKLGVRKALDMGIAVVGANNTWYTGMFAHYLEEAVAEGLVCMAAGSSSWRVAPYGAVQARFGTNPIAFGFPSGDDPIIFDTGTSELALAQIALARRRAESLSEGLAYDSHGDPTVDPAEALAGAVKVWGGHRGSGLALVVQLLGMMVGGLAHPADNEHCGFVFVGIRPDLFGDQKNFLASVANYAAEVRTARPERPGHPVRLPFERSMAARREAISRNAFSTDIRLVDELRRIAGSESAHR